MNGNDKENSNNERNKRKEQQTHLNKTKAAPGNLWKLLRLLIAVS